MDNILKIIWSRFRDVFSSVRALCMHSVWLFVTLWTVACQPPLSMGFPRQEYWNGVPFPPLGDLLDPGIEPWYLTSPALADRVSFFFSFFFNHWATWEARVTWSKYTWRTYNCAQHIVSTQRSCDYVLFGKSVKNNRKYAIEGLKLNLIWSKEARANWIITCQSLSV